MLTYLQSLSIRTKVIAGFGSVVLVICILGLVAIQRFANLNTSVQALSNDYVLSLGQLADMRVAMLNARLALVREVYVAADQKQRQAEDAKFLAEIETFNKVEQDYVKTITGADEQQLYDHVVAAKSALLASAEICSHAASQ